MILTKRSRSYKLKRSCIIYQGLCKVGFGLLIVTLRVAKGLVAVNEILRYAQNDSLDR